MVVKSLLRNDKRRNATLIYLVVVTGGQQIQQECQTYVLKHGNLMPGQVYVSVAGRLPCKKVIHAMGPSCRHHNADKTLHTAIHEVLLAGEKHKLSSVALPALSSGNMGFPIDKCTKIIVTAVKEFLDTHQQTCVKTISLVDQADSVLQQFRTRLGTMSGELQLYN